MTVEYVGFFSENTGFGRAARSHARALALGGIHFGLRSVLLSPGAVVEVPLRGRAASGLRKAMRVRERFDTLLVHTPPQRFSMFRDPAMRNIGITAWETPEPPRSWRTDLDSMDSLWVPSFFCRDALGTLTQKPISVVPHPIRPLADGPRHVPGVPDDSFLFLSILEWAERKNPIGLIRSFRRAFAGRRDVALLVKLSFRYGVGEATVLAKLADLCRGDRWPRVFACTEDLSDAAIEQLYRRADAYVSLHRAEGFGLCIAEAMAAGRPVVTTAYSGNMDFTRASTSFLVEMRRVPARDRLTPLRFFDTSMTWADPIEESAVEAMRSCVSDSSLRARRAAEGQQKVLTDFAPEVIGRQMSALLA